MLISAAITALFTLPRLAQSRSSWSWLPRRMPRGWASWRRRSASATACRPNPPVRPRHGHSLTRRPTGAVQAAARRPSPPGPNTWRQQFPCAEHTAHAGRPIRRHRRRTQCAARATISAALCNFHQNFNAQPPFPWAGLSPARGLVFPSLDLRRNPARPVLGANYWLKDYVDYGLPPPPYGAVWVRVGGDALLIDQYTGEVIAVEYGVFY